MLSARSRVEEFLSDFKRAAQEELFAQLGSEMPKELIMERQHLLSRLG